MDFHPGDLMLSPRTRRRQRGRESGVLDNVTTASTLTNATVITPEFLQSVSPLLRATAAMRGNQDHVSSPDEMVIQARGRRQVPLTFSPDVYTTPRLQQQHQMTRSRSALDVANNGQQQQQQHHQRRLILPTRTSPRKRLTLHDSPPPKDNDSSGSAKMSSSVFQTPSPDNKVSQSGFTELLHDFMG